MPPRTLPERAPAPTTEDSPPRQTSRPTLFDRIRHLFPSGQFLRYLVVGVWNTIFGYGLYVVFVHLYSKLLPHHYLPLVVDLASITSTPIGITNSFFCYKFFVFHTTGNYLKEWLRCFAVYGTGMIPGLIALPILTRVLQTVPMLHGVFAGYAAGALMTGFTAIYSYFGHKKFSFKA